MAFGQPAAGVIDQQFTVIKGRWRQSQRAIKQQLSCGAYEQIRAPHHLGNAHGRVIRHASELIGRDIIRPPDHKIAKIPPGHETL